MSPVRLDQYDNSWFSPGRPTIVQMLWFLLGATIVRSHWIPSSQLRVWILRFFGAHIADGVVIKPGVRVKFPWRLTIGAHTWIGEDAWLDNLAAIEIGRHACVSQGAYFCTGNHNWSDPKFGLITRGIYMGDGSWAGARCFIGPGVSLGECAVAAAGSVVARDIPAYEVHAGNPAAFIKKRHFSTDAGASDDSIQIFQEMTVSQ